MWLGVVYYLTPEAAHSTLAYIAGQAQPVEVVFDYLRAATTDAERAHQRLRAERLAGVGESVFSYFTPDGIAAQLWSLGFTGVEDHPAADLVVGYLGESAGGTVPGARPSPHAARKPLRTVSIFGAIQDIVEDSFCRNASSRRLRHPDADAGEENGCRSLRTRWRPQSLRRTTRRRSWWRYSPGWRSSPVRFRRNSSST
ncbi:hypothetical protein GCM10017774_38410 [Lentzea cavernae]|uniref:Uncharacterized protein n=1 Tax=Lentzea cavernae TaxID=2020703 RepID=A0ABQ3MGC0_9PSEU|nr:hypothetical protein GCM10017774_38410 [Lentzea cavernae]